MSNSYPSSEAISEIRADGALNGAEYGDPGQVVVTTKGGYQQVPRFCLLVLPELCF